MASGFGRRVVDFPLRPGSVVFNVAFASFRLLAKAGILKPNTQLPYVVRDDWMFILTPLAGSSSLRVQLSDIRTHNLLKCQRPPDCPHDKVKTCFVMSRDYEGRLGSFYNKKVRNPTTLGKARLLATCSPLSWKTTPQEFVSWISGSIEATHKDKHLYTLEQICAGFGIDKASARLIDISTQPQELEELLAISIGERVNSSESVSTFAAPLPLPPLSHDE